MGPALAHAALDDPGSAASHGTAAGPGSVAGNLAGDSQRGRTTFAPVGRHARAAWSAIATRAANGATGASNAAGARWTETERTS